MTKNEFLAKLKLLGFNVECKHTLCIYKHKNFNDVIIIQDTVVYFNQDWKTEKDFDLLIEDIINGPKRINS